MSYSKAHLLKHILFDTSTYVTCVTDYQTKEKSQYMNIYIITSVTNYSSKLIEVRHHYYYYLTSFRVYV